MTYKKFILNYDMRQLVKSSQDYKNYMQSDEIQELQSKIDLELTKIENEWNTFILIYRSLDTNKEEFTLEGKAKIDQQRQEQQKVIEYEEEKNEVLEVFKEKCKNRKHLNTVSRNT